MWFWLAMAAGLASAFDKVINRIALKDRDNVIVHSFLYISTIGVLSLILSFPIKVDFTSRLLGLVALQSIFWSLGTFFSFMSQTQTDVSLSMILSRTRIVWMIPLGFVFLREYPSSTSIVGMLVIFIGLFVLFFKGKFHKHRGIHLMLLGAVFVAFGTIINAILVKNLLTPAQTTFTTMASQSLVFLTVILLRRNVAQRVKIVLNRAWKLILSSAVMETYAFIGINLAFRLGYASSVTAVYLGMTIVTVWIGIIWLKERDHITRKILSSAIVTIGIVIVKIFS